jgi:hypothetical protein
MFVQNRRVANTPPRLVAPQSLVTLPVACIEQAMMSSLSSPVFTMVRGVKLMCLERVEHVGENLQFARGNVVLLHKKSGVDRKLTW